jgi:hypothetical protein
MARKFNHVKWTWQFPRHRSPKLWMQIKVQDWKWNDMSTQISRTLSLVRLILWEGTSEGMICWWRKTIKLWHMAKLWEECPNENAEMPKGRPLGLHTSWRLKSKARRLQKRLGGNTFRKLWRQEFGLSSKLLARGRTFFSLNNQSLTKSWSLDSRSYFEQGIKWHAPLSLDFGLGLWKLHTWADQIERPWEFMAKGLDFGLGLWRLHTMPGRRLHSLYFIG